jgi:hypothetical protein
MHEPGEPQRPDELPGHAPDELPVRGPQTPPRQHQWISEAPGAPHYSNSISDLK